MIIKKEFDYIIVGQGLAGTCLALHLLKEGKHVLVFDEPTKNKCSTVAAGLFNPITGKIMSRTWQAHLLFPYLHQFYSSCEKEWGTKFYHSMPLYRPFVSIEEQNEWMGLSSEENTAEWVHHVYTSSHYPQAHDSLGGILLKHCGYVDVNKFLALTRNHLKQQDSFQEQFFDSSLLDVKMDEVCYRNFRASKIIFTTGVHQNEWFKYLPVRPLKGETLSLKLSQTPDVIFNRGVYVVPTQTKDVYKVGATYQPKDVTEGTTAEGQGELKEKLDGLLKIPYDVVDKDWGIRPTTPDRKPLLGEHPEQKNVVIFNGLGTKGVSLAPYFAGQLATWLLGRGEIQKEVNINRFKALYSKP